MNNISSYILPAAAVGLGGEVLHEVKSTSHIEACNIRPRITLAWSNEKATRLIDPYGRYGDRTDSLVTIEP